MLVRHIHYGAQDGASGLRDLILGVDQVLAPHGIVTDHQHGAVAEFGDLRGVDDHTDGRRVDDYIVELFGQIVQQTLKPL